jgi:CHAT domain-containing protein
LGDGLNLVERAAVVYVPSVTVLGQLAERRAKRPPRDKVDFLSIGIAFPEEALAILQIFSGMGLTGNSLSKDHIRMMLDGKSIVHMSCHGHFDSELPLESGLHLRSSGSVKLSDILSVRDLSRWHLDCDLITLSACESGRGEPAVSEFLGLTRNLLAAGAASVIAALWPVDRLQTMTFMLEFYKDLHARCERAGDIDIAEALRATQIRLSHEAGFADWAAFKLIGFPFMSLAGTPPLNKGKSDD